MAPLAGEQILTVLLTVGVHAADATFADPRRRVAARRARSEIIRGPVQKKNKAKIYLNVPGIGPECVDVAPPAQAHFVPPK